MIPVLVGIIGGTICGIISGLAPGIHSNMIAALLLGFSPTLLPVLGPEGMAAVLIATLITHSFLEIIPATFLGVPDDGTALSVLPAHSLTLDGKGEEAVRISALGSLWGVIFAVPLAIMALWFIPLLQSSVDLLTGSLLVLVMGMIIVRSEAAGWLFALCLVSGLLGLFAFRYDYLSWNTLGAGNILIPLLTGLFGLPFLLTASEGAIPAQKFTGLSLSTGQPGKVCPSRNNSRVNSQVAPRPVSRQCKYSNLRLDPYDKEKRNYLAAIGASTLANSIVGIAVFVAIGRMRNGVMIAFSGFETPPVLFLLTIHPSLTLCILHHHHHGQNSHFLIWILTVHI